MENTITVQSKENLAARLRRLRLNKRITAAEMARLIGVAPTTYREWEKSRGLSLPPFQKISQVLAISVTELISGEKPNMQVHLESLEQIEKLLRELRLKLSAIS